MRNQLQRAITALAQPAEVQLSLFPDFVCKADELALDFEDDLYETATKRHLRTRNARRSTRSTICFRRSLASGMPRCGPKPPLASTRSGTKSATRQRQPLQPLAGTSRQCPPPTPSISPLPGTAADPASAVRCRQSSRF